VPENEPNSEGVKRERKMSFAEWLAVARITDDPEGDFVEDARRDPTFPEDFPDAEAVRWYLRRHGACREALAVVPRVWRRYQAWLERRGVDAASDAARDS
jgi:uncharacterized protein YozE (UPF0346 family)